MSLQKKSIDWRVEEALSQIASSTSPAGAVLTRAMREAVTAAVYACAADMCLLCRKQERISRAYDGRLSHLVDQRWQPCHASPIWERIQRAGEIKLPF